MAAALSASRTKGAAASAAEYTAIVRIPKRRAVRMMRRAISPRFAMSSDSITRLHPKQTESRPFRDRLVQGRGKCQAQNIARLSRIDDPVVPQASRCIVRIAFRLVTSAHRRLERSLLVGRPEFVA